MEPLWADLVNSDWRDYLGSGRREDRLDNDRWLSGFLGRTAWRRPGLPTEAERDRLRRLRALLRRLVDAAVAGRELPATDVESLDRLLAEAPVVRRLERAEDDWRIVLSTLGDGIDDVLGDVAASFAATLVAGDAERIKICENPDCGWVFLDGTKNRSRRWCDASDCGNVMKVRRYRRRHRDAALPG